MRLNTQYGSMVRTPLSMHAAWCGFMRCVRSGRRSTARQPRTRGPSKSPNSFVPKVADRDNKRLEAARSAARLADALIAAPAPHVDQRIEENVSGNDINSRKAAFETWMSEQPWTQGPRRPDETGLRERLREAMALRARPPAPAPPRSPQSRNFRVGPQLPLDIVTGRPEDNAGGAPGLQLGETFAQRLARARERHLLGVGHVHQRVMAV
jgi:hypothetical protein